MHVAGENVLVSLSEIHFVLLGEVFRSGVIVSAIYIFV